MKKTLKIIVGVIVLGIALSFVFGGAEQIANNELQKIENQVVADAVKQYKIAKENGSAMDAYVQAGIVAAAFLQAKDEENYKKWKKVEKEEAKKVGL